MLTPYQMQRECRFVTLLPATDRIDLIADAYHNIAHYGQPFVLQQQPQAQQHPPPQPAPGPARGHPIPSPSPVNATNPAMVITQLHDPNAKVSAPGPVPNVAATPFKPRQKKIALIQDPNTMEVVDLKTNAADSSQASTSQRSTPSVEPVKADVPSDVPAPEPVKSLPNVSCVP